MYVRGIKQIEVPFTQKPVCLSAYSVVMQKIDMRDFVIYYTCYSLCIMVGRRGVDERKKPAYIHYVSPFPFILPRL